METLVLKLQRDFPEYSFTVGDTLCWSPRTKEIVYTAGHPHSEAGLLHELAHAKLGHAKYTKDVDLLSKEVSAWVEAQKLAEIYNVKIDNEHIQNCLDTYRDWLHKRSACPACGANSLQDNTKRYKCINCRRYWSVTNSRLCRPYRRSKTKKTG